MFSALIPSGKTRQPRMAGNTLWLSTMEGSSRWYSSPSSRNHSRVLEKLAVNEETIKCSYPPSLLLCCLSHNHQQSSNQRPKGSTGGNSNNAMISFPLNHFNTRHLGTHEELMPSDRPGQLTPRTSPWMCFLRRLGQQTHWKCHPACESHCLGFGVDYGMDSHSVQWQWGECGWHT